MEQPLRRHYEQLKDILKQYPSGPSSESPKGSKMTVTQNEGLTVECRLFDVGAEPGIYKVAKGGKGWTAATPCSSDAPFKLSIGDTFLMFPFLLMQAIKCIQAAMILEGASLLGEDSDPIRRLSFTFFQILNTDMPSDGVGDGWSLCNPQLKLAVPWEENAFDTTKIYPLGRASSALQVPKMMTSVSNCQAVLTLSGNTLSIESKSKRKTCVVRNNSIYLLTGGATAELKPDDIIVSSKNCRPCVVTNHRDLCTLYLGTSTNYLLFFLSSVLPSFLPFLIFDYFVGAGRRFAVLVWLPNPN